jgi:hypothetical protein
MMQRTKRRGPKKSFTFTITYFKPNGGYWHKTQVVWEIHTKLDSPNTPMMDDAAARLRGLRGNGPGSMPGLGDDASDWHGYMLIEHYMAFPVLILPEKN